MVSTTSGYILSISCRPFSYLQVTGPPTPIPLSLTSQIPPGAPRRVDCWWCVAQVVNSASYGQSKVKVTGHEVILSLRFDLPSLLESA